MAHLLFSLCLVAIHFPSWRPRSPQIDSSLPARRSNPSALLVWPCMSRSHYGGLRLLWTQRPLSPISGFRGTTRVASLISGSTGRCVHIKRSRPCRAIFPFPSRAVRLWARSLIRTRSSSSWKRVFVAGRTALEVKLVCLHRRMNRSFDYGGTSARRRVLSNHLVGPKWAVFRRFRAFASLSLWRGLFSFARFFSIFVVTSFPRYRIHFCECADAVSFFFSAFSVPPPSPFLVRFLCVCVCVCCTSFSRSFFSSSLTTPVPPPLPLPPLPTSATRPCDA